MAEVTMTLEEYNLLISQIQSAHQVDSLEARAPAKKKRRASKYNKEFAKQYKALRKKHPRMTHGQITSKAHKASKKALK